MAGIHAISSLSDSLAQFLENTYPGDLRDLYPCDFRVVSSSELESEDDFGTAVTIYIYRLIVNEHLRNSARLQTTGEKPPLSLDLHILLSVWSDTASAEQTVGAWIMNQLHHHPILDQSSLTAEGEWLPGDVIHIIPAELSNEDLMRIWDAINPSYRLSLSYIARSIRIDPQAIGGEVPVVARRLAYEAHRGQSRV